MPGFKYYTKSADWKMKGSVTASYIRSKVMRRTIEGVGTANDGSFIEFYLSDGAQVTFVLAGDFGPEVQYLASTR